MIEAIPLKRNVDYPDELRERVRAFNKAMFAKYWGDIVPLEELGATLARFTVESPTDDEVNAYAALISARDKYQEAALGPSPVN